MGNTMQYHASLITADGAYHCPVGSIMAIFSSVMSCNSHPDLLVTHHHPTHFFRSHRSSTLDFHFLSHYSYIKAIMLYKGNHWARCAGFIVASWVRLGITNDDLGTFWGQPGDDLGMTWALLWQILARLWYTLAYSGILWHTLSYSGILLHTLTYSGILWHTLEYSGICWHTLAYSGIIWHTLAYSCILWYTLAYSCIHLHTLAYSGILWHTLAYSGILWHTLACSCILGIL